MTDSQTANASIARAKADILSATSTIAGATLLIANMTAAVRAQSTTLADSGVDTSGIDGVLDAFESKAAELSQSVAANTPASDEVHVDDGGTGTAAVEDGGTVVDAEAAATDATAAAAAAPKTSEGDGSQGAQA